MSASRGQSGKGAKAPQRRKARTGNIYDRIAEARDKRENAPKAPPKPATIKKQPAPPPAEKPVSPVELPSPETLERLSRPAKPANTPTRPKTLPPVAPAVPEPAKEDNRKSLGFWLWIASAVIAAILIGLVAFGYQPPGRSVQIAAPTWSVIDVQTVLPTEDAQPSAPVVITGFSPEPLPPLGPEARPDAAPVAQSDGSIATPPAFDPAAYRIVLHVPQSVSDANLQRITTGIEAAGLIAEPRRITLSISKSNLRYYHAEDAAIAAVLALTANAELRDFTAFRPRPAEGLIEIWLAGRRGAAPAQQPSTLADEFKALRARIAHALGGR